MLPDWAGIRGAIPGSRSATAPERLLPRGRHDLPREFVAHTQRDRLIDAMASTVGARGYAGASLGEVCAAAGVSTKAFYQHFADKEACFLATFKRGVTLMQTTVLAAYARPARWPVRMRVALDTLLHVLAAEPAFARLAVVEVLAAGPRARDCRRDLLATYYAFFADAPRRAGQPEVPDRAVAAIVAGVYGVIFEYVSTCLPDLTYFMLAPFIGPRAAAANAAG